MKGHARLVSAAAVLSIGLSLASACGANLAATGNTAGSGGATQRASATANTPVPSPPQGNKATVLKDDRVAADAFSTPRPPPGGRGAYTWRTAAVTTSTVRPHSRRPPGPVSVPRDVPRPRGAPTTTARRRPTIPAAPPLKHEARYARDCADVQLRRRSAASAGDTRDGKTVVYRPGCLKPAACAMNVTCDFATDGGGWTVFQQRLDDSVDFAQDWRAYTQGFGNTANFWLGNEYLHELTSLSGRSYQLLVQLNDFTGRSGFALYDTVTIDSEANYFTLHLGTMLGGDVDNMAPFNGQPFGTPEQSPSCASKHQSGWWHNINKATCPGFVGNLNAPYDGLADGANGQYVQGLRVGGIQWATAKYGVVRVRSVQMKLRPKEFDQPMPVWRINQSLDRWRRKQSLDDMYEYEYPAGV